MILRNSSAKYAREDRKPINISKREATAIVETNTWRNLTSHSEVGFFEPQVRWQQYQDDSYANADKTQKPSATRKEERASSSVVVFYIV